MIYPRWFDYWDQFVPNAEKTMLMSLNGILQRENTSASILLQLRAEKFPRQADLCFYKFNSRLLDFYYLYLDECLGARERNLLRCEREAAKSLEAMIPYQNACLVSESPLVTRTDSRGRLSSPRSPAAVYGDGWKFYAIDGIWVPEYIVERPREITIAKIDAEGDIRLRRIMVRQYAGDYYSDCGATLEATDRLGRLYRKKRRGDWDLTFVRVTNSTREPDGTFRQYTLRVPPAMRTPTDAIAWTFGMTRAEYLRIQKMT